MLFRSELKALVAAYPNNMQYRILLGSVYVENDMLEEAKAVYDEAKKLNSSDAYLFIALSDYYNRTGDKEASIKLMKEALINEELDVYTKIQILTDYLKTLVYRNESLEDTDELFQTIIDQHPQEAEVRSLYAEVLNRNEKRGAAIEQLEYAVAFNPNEEKYWNSLGHAYLSAGEWEKLVDVTSKAKEYFPASPFIYFYKGIAYQNLNQNEKAREVYEEAIKNIDQKDVNTISTFYGQVGDVWYQLNDKIGRAHV